MRERDDTEGQGISERTAMAVLPPLRIVRRPLLPSLGGSFATRHRPCWRSASTGLHGGAQRAQRDAHRVSTQDVVLLRWSACLHSALPLSDNVEYCLYSVCNLCNLWWDLGDEIWESRYLPYIMCAVTNCSDPVQCAQRVARASLRSPKAPPILPGGARADLQKGPYP